MLEDTISYRTCKALGLWGGGGCRQGIEAQLYHLLAEEKIYYWVPGFKLAEVTQKEDLDSESSPYHFPLTLAGYLHLSESAGAYRRKDWGICELAYTE